MKRLPFYILLVALVFMAPVERVDVGKLQPVEAVAVYKEDDKVVLETDTGDIGRGVDVLQALADLKETSPAVIYLDTAEFLLVAENMEKEAELLRDDLKGSVRICLTDGKIDVKTAAKYLEVHSNLPKFRQWKTGDNLPVLTEEKIIEKSRI